MNAPTALSVCARNLTKKRLEHFVFQQNWKQYGHHAIRFRQSWNDGYMRSSRFHFIVNVFWQRKPVVASCEYPVSISAVQRFRLTIRQDTFQILPALSQSDDPRSAGLSLNALRYFVDIRILFCGSCQTKYYKIVKKNNKQAKTHIKNTDHN